MSNEEKRNLLKNCKNTLEEMKTGRVLSNAEKKAWMEQKEMETDSVKTALIEKLDKRRSK